MQAHWNQALFTAVLAWRNTHELFQCRWVILNGNYFELLNLIAVYHNYTHAVNMCRFGFGKFDNHLYQVGLSGLIMGNTYGSNWMMMSRHKITQGCQPVRNFRILYGFYMQNTGVRIWPRKYGNWALSVLSLKVLLPEQSLPVLGSKSVRICGILCLRTFKYPFNHQNIQSSLFHM